jgi:hypothetical protein
MGNARIPTRGTRVIERAHGIDADGDVITLAVFRHVRAGHELPEFYVVQYHEHGRRIDRGTRVTQQFSGPRAAERMDAELAEARELLAESRVRAAAGR